MKRIIFSLLAGLFSTFTALQVQAQTEPQKIGTVDFQYILINLPEYKQLDTDIKLYEQQLKTQLDSKGDEFKRKSEEYQRGVESNMLLPSIRADKEKELYAMEQSIQEFQQTAQEDLQSKYLSMMDPINAKIYASIDKVAAANNYTYIISNELFSGEKVVMYAKSKDTYDISLLVLKDLGVIIPPPSSTPTTTTAPKTTAPKTTAPTNTSTPTMPAKTAPVKK